jgi:hypothetical protein
MFKNEPLPKKSQPNALAYLANIYLPMRYLNIADPTRMTTLSSINSNANETQHKNCVLL